MTPAVRSTRRRLMALAALLAGITTLVLALLAVDAIQDEAAFGRTRLVLNVLRSGTAALTSAPDQAQPVLERLLRDNDGLAFLAVVGEGRALAFAGQIPADVTVAAEAALKGAAGRQGTARLPGGLVATAGPVAGGTLLVAAPASYGPGEMLSRFGLSLLLALAGGGALLGGGAWVCGGAVVRRTKRLAGLLDDAARGRLTHAAGLEGPLADSLRQSLAALRRQATDAGEPSPPPAPPERRTRLLLSTRVTVFSLAAVLALGLGLWQAGRSREAYQDAYQEQRLLRLQQGALQQAIAARGDRLKVIVDGLRQDPTLATALRAGEAARAAAVESLQRKYARRASLVEITDGGAAGLGLLGAAPLEAVLRQGQEPVGVRLIDGRLLIVAAGPVADGGDRPGAVVVGTELAQILPALANAVNAEALLLDRAGRVISGKAELWRRVSHEDVDLERRSVRVVRQAGTALSVSALPVPDLAGGRLGAVVLVQDISDAEQRQSMLTRSVAIAAAAFALILSFGLYGWLRRSFGPLGEAVEVINALSQGRLDVGAALRPGDDEIGKLSGAIAVLRDDLQALQSLRDQEGRRRQQQEQFIRREMLALADTLDEGARAAFLNDLGEIERGAGGERLGALAAGFRRMAMRVTEQHRLLTELVEELRDALEHKTKLMSLQQELQFARDIQQSVLPQKMLDASGVQVVGRMEPAKEVGGDFYDFFAIDADHIGIAVADVSGKGVPAAFFMLITRTLLKANAMFGVPPGLCLQRLNDLLARENEQMMFVTVFYGVLDRRTGRLSYANGGHNPPYLLRDGRVDPLVSPRNMALAVAEEVPYAEACTTLRPGDVLFLFSDGVTESFDVDGAMFGDARLTEVLAACSTDGAAEVVAEVFDAVQRFSEGAAQADDITGVAIRYVG